MTKLTISRVLDSKELTDVVLNKVTTTSSNTVHPRFKITKIRKFYINKVTLCRNEFTKRLRTTVRAFPQINDLTPFNKAMMSILYDFDSYKIALSHLSFATNSIDKAATNSIKLLKYADSPYACKKLKIAAFGHMSKIIKKLNKYLLFLEQVRMHLLRIPKIDCKKETLVLCGLPNTGKSSLLNLLTRAKSEVESYAFSTTAIYRGFMEYEGIQKQILDTPGLLDRPFEERNSAEMQAIAAIGKLDCEILFTIDVTLDIQEQLTLLKTLKPLLYSDSINTVEYKDSEVLRQQKKLWIVKTKCDLLIERQEKQEFDICFEKEIKLFIEESGLDVFGVLESYGTITSGLDLKEMISGIESKDKNEILFKPKQKIEMKVGKIIEWGNIEHEELNNMLEENDAVENDLREFHKLENKEWKYDFVPEIFEGENVADYYCINAAERLKDLKEEDILMENEFEKIRTEMSRQIFDKEYFELKEKEKQEIDNMAMGIVKKIVESNKKGNRISKAKLVALKEKRRKRTENRSLIEKKLRNLKK